MITAMMRRRALTKAPLLVTYTGSYTDEIVSMDGSPCRLLTLLSSGTLALSRETLVDLCVIGAGVSPGASQGSTDGDVGGSGGRIAQAFSQSFVGAAVVIGAPAKTAGATSIGTLASGTATANYPPAGGSGGGAGGCNALRGVGAGISTRPFGSNYFQPHAAGGGGSGYGDQYDSIYTNGGAGGSNGATGSYGGSAGGSGGAGGNFGGGKGGNYNQAGASATYYGSGGGRGGLILTAALNWTTKSSGAGYQGVAYVRIPTT